MWRVRTRIPNEQKAKGKAVSMAPELFEFVRHRAFAANMTISRYFQTLAEHDRENDVLPKAITARLARAKIKDGPGMAVVVAVVCAALAFWGKIHAHDAAVLAAGVNVPLPEPVAQCVHGVWKSRWGWMVVAGWVLVLAAML
jgi:hypothetical protein